MWHQVRARLARPTTQQTLRLNGTRVHGALACLRLRQLPQEIRCFATSTAPCLNGHHQQQATPRNDQLELCVLLVAPCSHQDCAINLCNFGLGFTCRVQSASQGDVDCQLRSAKSRHVLGQNLNPPLVGSRDAKIHVSQSSVEFHPGPRFTTHPCKDTFLWDRPLLDSS